MTDLETVLGFARAVTAVPPTGSNGDWRGRLPARYGPNSVGVR